MKKLLVMFMVSLFIITGCSSNDKTDKESKTEEKKATKEEITLENGLELTITDKKLTDSYGDYYATENGAILVLYVEVKNPSKKELSFGTGNVKMYTNKNGEFSKTFTGDKEGLMFINKIAAGDTLKGTLVFPSPVKYKATDKVYLDFFDILDNPLGKLDLSLTSLEKEVTDVTAESKKATTEGNMLVNEMGGYSVKLGNPTILTSDEFTAAYPEYTLGLKNQYRYLMFDAEITNKSGTDLNMSKNPFKITDNFGDVDIQQNYKLKTSEGIFDVNTAIPNGETRTGKILYTISVSTTKVTIKTNPVGGVNSDFIFDFDIVIK